MKRILLLLPILLSQLAQAEMIYEIDVSECVRKDHCDGLYAGDMYEPGYINEENLRIQAWFDIVRFKDEEMHSFFPLFNVFNLGTSPISVELNMALLNSDKDVLAERSFSYDVVPYSGNGDPSKESFISMNAVPIEKENIANVSFVRVSHHLDSASSEWLRHLVEWYKKL